MRYLFIAIFFLIKSIVYGLYVVVFGLWHFHFKEMDSYSEFWESFFDDFMDNHYYGGM